MWKKVEFVLDNCSSCFFHNKKVTCPVANPTFRCEKLDKRLPFSEQLSEEFPPECPLQDITLVG